MKLWLLVFPIAVTVTAGSARMPQPPPSSKQLIAHRGASAYTPEHTIAAYRRALEQDADFVEQDLQISKDGVLVCLHDLTLERTTNVEEVYPARFKTDAGGARSWPVADFTVAELKRLDAGGWFDAKFAGERIPTWQEAIDLIRGKAGLYPETKGPEVYGSLGFDMEALVLEQLEANRLATPGADARTPVIVQSFSADSLKKMRAMGTRLPLVFLVSDRDPARDRWLDAAGLREMRGFADGIGPAKSLLLADRALTARAHAARLSVTPYTFRAATRADHAKVREEMALFLYDLGVDALFTDNPDQFPRR